MPRKDDGGPAFTRPATVNPTDGATEWRMEPGMSLRDYFAGQALVGLLFGVKGTGMGPAELIEGSATGAYLVADAMLRERAK